MPPDVARKLGIDLSSRREGELFKWLLACLLFGKPIQHLALFCGIGFPSEASMFSGPLLVANHTSRALYESA